MVKMDLKMVILRPEIIELFDNSIVNLAANSPKGKLAAMIGILSK